jgi:FixJ family two-component response regulator
MSGAFDDARLRAASTAGVEVILQKPVHEASVLDAVARALALRRRSLPEETCRAPGLGTESLRDDRAR